MAFETYGRSGDTQIPTELVSHGGQVYDELCASQSQPRLLHGDLHHENVLSDSNRGWLAIDPKGVVGEVAYEIGAALRNPIERPSVLADRATLQRRIQRFERALNLDAHRILAWGFAQAVLSAIWTFEDEGTIEPTNPSLALAETIRPMLGSLA
jgi:streptomycin 6-kinase